MTKKIGMAIIDAVIDEVIEKASIEGVNEMSLVNANVTIQPEDLPKLRWKIEAIIEGGLL